MAKPRKELPIPGAPGHFLVPDDELTDDELALIAWAESDDIGVPDPNDSEPLRGAEAAAFGQDRLIAALGSRDAALRATGGRRPLDPNAKPGQHSPVRQVRLPATLDDALAARATAENRTPSDIIREALTAYLEPHIG